jgi:hypothetical protein
MKKYRWGLAGQNRSRTTLTDFPRGPPPALRPIAIARWHRRVLSAFV